MKNDPLAGNMQKNVLMELLVAMAFQQRKVTTRFDSPIMGTVEMKKITFIFLHIVGKKSPVWPFFWGERLSLMWHQGSKRLQMSHLPSTEANGPQITLPSHHTGWWKQRFTRCFLVISEKRRSANKGSLNLLPLYPPGLRSAEKRLDPRKQGGFEGNSSYRGVWKWSLWKNDEAVRVRPQQQLQGRRTPARCHSVGSGLRVAAETFAPCHTPNTGVTWCKRKTVFKSSEEAFSLASSSWATTALKDWMARYHLHPHSINKMFHWSKGFTCHQLSYTIVEKGVSARCRHFLTALPQCFLKQLDPNDVAAGGVVQVRTEDFSAMGPLQQEKAYRSQTRCTETRLKRGGKENPL